MLELNQSLINQSVSTSTTTQNNQGGINMNNEQMKAMVMEAKQDLMNGLEKLNAIEAMLSEQTVEVKEDTFATEPETGITFPAVERPLDLNEQLMAQFQEKAMDMFQVTEDDETEENDEDLVELLAKEFGPKDMSRDPEVKVDGGISIVDEAQAEAIADALDFMDNPEAHEDAFIETEEEEEAPAPEEIDALAHMTEALKDMFVKSVYEEMDEEEPVDEIDIDLGLDESPEENPFENVHVPTKREKREQAAAIELELNTALISKENSTPAEEPAIRRENKEVAVISGPINQSLLFNSARVSYKNGSNDFVLALVNHMKRAVNTLYLDGVREFRVGLLNGIELLVPLFWEDIKAACPEAVLSVYDNQGSKFQRYMGKEDEAKMGIYSPARLSEMLLAIADTRVMVKGNAFKIRQEMAKGSTAYIRVLPKGHEDAGNRFMKKEHKALLICPWSLDVFKTGAYEPKLIEGPGVDFRPVHLKKQQAHV